ncbi:MAG: HD domain-containing protein [Chloroflexi bacterium]|nr:HD domain-containing protein [Chloroflexota bacterium]
MEYQDAIYGTVQITEPVLMDLMHSAAVQRLHGVLQHGVSALIGLTTPITRFEHSVGTMLIVRRLRASVNEQIAALLHDVSHTAFSHVIDHVLNSPDSQSYHDEMKEQYMVKTDLPQILAAHGYDWTEFLDEEQYPLLEQPSPRLCADRIDYTLRDCTGLGLATEVDILGIVEQLVVVNGRIAITNIDIARKFATIYINADDKSWANFFEVGIYELTAQAIRTGLRVGAIKQADFWSTDQLLWEKLHNYPHPQLQAELALVSPETVIVWDEAQPDIKVRTKIRTIDPDVVVDGGIRPLSTLDAQFEQFKADYLQRKQGVWPMRIVKPS